MATPQRSYAFSLRRHRAAEKDSPAVGTVTIDTVLLILHLVLVALCIWHLTVCSGYGEARMRFVLPLIVFMPGAAILYLMSAREGTVPPDTIKTGSSSPVYFEHRLGFRDGGRSRWGLPRRHK